MPTFAPKARPLARALRCPAKCQPVRRRPSARHLQWQYHHQSGQPKLQREPAQLDPGVLRALGNHFGQITRRRDSDELPKPDRTVSPETVDVLKLFFCHIFPLEGICTTLRDCDENPEPCEEFVGKLQDLFSRLLCDPACERFDFVSFSCLRKRLCSCLDIDEARRFAIDKLGQTGGYVPRWAARMRAGQASQAMPSNLTDKVTKGAQTVVAALTAGTIKVECDPTFSGNVGLWTHPDSIRLGDFISLPTWTQQLLNQVVLHESMHAVMSHLPGQVGTDPYDSVSNSTAVMHDDLLSVTKGHFPKNAPSW